MRNLNKLPLILGIAAAAFVTTKAPDAHALFCCKSLTSWVSNKASAVSDFASSAASKVKSAASTVVNKTWEVTKSAASTVSNAASSTVKAVVSTAKKGYEAVKKTATSAYNTGSRWAKQGWTAVSNAGKKTWGFAKDGAKWVGQKTKEGAKWVGNKVQQGMSWVKDKFNIIQKYGARVLEGVKKFVQAKISPLVSKVWTWAKEKLNQALNMAKSASPAFAEIVNVVQGKTTIAEAVGNLHAAHGAALKAKVTEALTGAAMKVLKRPMTKLVGWVVDKILKLLQTPIAKALATALSSAIASAVAAVTAGIGAFLQPLLQPLTSWTADKILDWARGKVKDPVAKWIFEKSQGALRSYIVRPLIVRAYDGLESLLKRKFPKVFGLINEAQPVADEQPAEAQE